MKKNSKSGPKTRLKEHPEICPGCVEWVDVVQGYFIDHEWPGGPRNAHERRSWKKHGRPKCSGSGKWGRAGEFPIYVEDHRN